MKQNKKWTSLFLSLGGIVFLGIIVMLMIQTLGVHMDEEFRVMPGKDGITLSQVNTKPNGSVPAANNAPEWLISSNLRTVVSHSISTTATTPKAIYLESAGTSLTLTGGQNHPSGTSLWFVASGAGTQIDVASSVFDSVTLETKIGTNKDQVKTSSALSFLVKGAGYTKLHVEGEEMLEWDEGSVSPQSIVESWKVTSGCSIVSDGAIVTDASIIEKLPPTAYVICSEGTINIPITVHKSRLEPATGGDIDIFVQPRFRTTGGSDAPMTIDKSQMTAYRSATTQVETSINTNVMELSTDKTSYQIRYLMTTTSGALSASEMENSSYVYDGSKREFLNGKFAITTSKGKMTVENKFRLAGEYFIWMYMDGFSDVTNATLKPVCIRLLYETSFSDLVVELDIDPKKNRDSCNMSDMYNVGNIDEFFDNTVNGTSVAHYNNSVATNCSITLGATKESTQKNQRRTGKCQFLFNCKKDTDFLKKDDGSYFKAGDSFSIWILAIDRIAFKVNDPNNKSNLGIEMVDDTTLKVAATGKAALNCVYTTVTSPVWKSDNPSVATVKDGIVSGISPGTAHVTATVTEGGEKKTVTCTVKVVAASEVLSLDKTTYVATLGQPFYITASGSGISACKWIIDDKTILDFEEKNMDGKDTAKIKPLKKGIAVISIYNAEEAIVASCSVQVNYAATRIAFGNKLKTLSLHQTVGTYQLAAVLTPTDPYAEIVWESADSKVATVNNTGMLTLKSPGTTTITIFPKYNPNNIHASLTLTVTQPVAGIKMDKTSITLSVGKTEKLTYTLNPAEPTIKTVKWSCLNTKICQVKDGVVTAKSVGQTYVTVTTTDGNYIATCMVTVTQEATSVKLDVSNLTLRVGDVYFVQTTFTPVNATTSKLTWTVQDPKVCTVTSSGKVTGVGAGKTSILVKTASGEVVSLYVTVQQGVDGLELDYQEKNVIVGRKFKLTPVFTPAEPTNQIVKWESSNSSVATVNEKGKVQTLKPGMAIITCTSDDGGYVAACAVTVRKLITSITLNKSSYKLGVGKSITLKATLDSNDVTNPYLKWSSSNNKVASVDKTGKVTGKSVGKCRITVMAKDGSEATASCQIQVVQQVSQIKLSLTTLRLLEGSSKKITAKVSPKDATYQSVNWKSENENVATIDANGNVFAVKEGSCRLYATAKDNGKVEAYCWVYVTSKVPATGITVSQKDIMMVKGQSEGLLVTVQPVNTTDKLRYSSDNKAVATVDDNGKITAIKSGVANVTIMSTSGQQTTATVTVVGLNKTNVTMNIYDKDTLWVEEVSQGVTWQSENPSIVSVSNGQITSLQAGSTNIVATIKGVRLVCHVTVRNAL